MLTIYFFKTILHFVVIRIDDKQANQMAGSTWSYIAKSEWKSQKREPTPVKEKEKSKKS